MLEELRERWRAREATASIRETMDFGPDGLVLGAGTVLASHEASAAQAPDEDQEARLLTLLSAAYGRPVSWDVLKHIRRAALRWDEGDAAMAAMHLALTRLNRLPAPKEAARRLFMADELMKAGFTPVEILSSIDIDPSAVSPTLAKYSAGQPRVPRGSGRPSGRWASEALAFSGVASAVVRRELAAVAERGAAVAGQVAASAAQQAVRAATSLSATDLAMLALTAARVVGGPAAFLGVAFIPSTIGRNSKGPLPGAPGWRYARSDNDLYMRFTYDGPYGAHQDFLAHKDPDGTLRTPHGQIVGKVLPDGRTAIELKAVSPSLVKEDEPNLCPKPTKDRGGSEAGRNYEDFVKLYVNPKAPTPRGLGVELSNPFGGSSVMYDDCQHSTGDMIEAIGPRYDFLLDHQDWDVIQDLLDQSLKQVEARHGRHIIWYFAESGAAEKAKRLFDKADEGRSVIEIRVLPWKKGQK